MRSIPTSEPTELTAGDSWQWDKTLGDYRPTDGWALEYVLVGAMPFAINVTNARLVVSGDTYQVRVPAADTASLAAGAYRFAAYVSKAGDRFEILRTAVAVRANIATLTDGRTVAEKELAIVDAAISGRLTNDLQSYQINGRAVNKIPIEMLYQIRGRLRSQVWRERSPGQLGRPVRMRFGQPS